MYLKIMESEVVLNTKAFAPVCAFSVIEGALASKSFRTTGSLKTTLKSMLEPIP